MTLCDALGAIGLAADIVIVVMQRSFVSCLIASLSVIWELCDLHICGCWASLWLLSLICKVITDLPFAKFVNLSAPRFFLDGLDWLPFDLGHVCRLTASTDSCRNLQTACVQNYRPLLLTAFLSSLRPSVSWSHVAPRRDEWWNQQRGSSHRDCRSG